MYTRSPPVGKRFKRSSDTKLPLLATPIRDENGLESTKDPDGRLAQPVRAPALQAGGPRFEPATAHHTVKKDLFWRLRKGPLVVDSSWPQSQKRGF